MGRLDKLKREAINEANIRVLTEQKAGDKVSGYGQWMNTHQFDTFVEGLFVDGPIHTATGTFKKYKKLKDSLLWNNEIDKIFKLGKGIVGVSGPETTNTQVGSQSRVDYLGRKMIKDKMASGRRCAAFYFWQKENDKWSFYGVVACN